MSTDRHHRVAQLCTTAYTAVEFFCIIKCPEVLFKGFNYILVWSDWAGRHEDHENGGSHQTARKTVPQDQVMSRALALLGPTRILLAPTWAQVSLQPPPEPQHSPRPRMGGWSAQAQLQVLFSFLIYVPKFPGKILLVQVVFSTPRTPSFTLPTQADNIH